MCAQKGGVVGVNGIGLFLRPAIDDQADLVATHVDHMVQLGRRRHVASVWTTSLQPRSSERTLPRCERLSPRSSAITPRFQWCRLKGCRMLSRACFNAGTPIVISAQSLEATFHGLPLRSGDLGWSPAPLNGRKVARARQAARRSLDGAFSDDKAVAMSSSSKAGRARYARRHSTDAALRRASASMKCAQADEHRSRAAWRDKSPSAASLDARASVHRVQAFCSSASARANVSYSGRAEASLARETRAADRLHSCDWDRKGVGSGCAEVTSVGLTFMPDTVVHP